MDEIYANGSAEDKGGEWTVRLERKKNNSVWETVENRRYGGDSEGENKGLQSQQEDSLAIIKY